MIFDNLVMSHRFRAWVSDVGASGVVLGSDPSTCISQLLRLRPNLVVIRRTLDESSGLELCQRVRAEPRLRHTRILAVSTEPDFAAEAVLAGAHAHLTLPCTSIEAQQALRAQIDAQPTILLVEDLRAQRMAMIPALKTENWEVVEAANGKMALEVLRVRGDIDLVVTDVEMPEINGWDLCAAIKGDPRRAHLPVVLVTSLDSHAHIARGFALGADDYLTKPILMPELVTRIKRLLQKRRRSDRVLVADAQLQRRNALVQALVAQGLDVEGVQTAEEAVARLELGEFQLAVADLELDDVNGIELARRLRSHAHLGDIPILLISDRTGRVANVEAISAGVQAVVARPYAPERVLAEVERVLHEAKLERQHRALRRYLSGEALAAMEEYVERGPTSVARAGIRQKTVLFVDLVGFTSLCEEREADDVVRILNAFFDAAVPVLVRHGASIDKFIGDCILAVYDADGARGAVEGALELVQTVLPELRVLLNEELHVRIGIHSGCVIVGDIGSRDFRRDYTVIGDTVNLAQRIQSAAEVDEVLVSGRTHSLIKHGGFGFGESKVLQVKGRQGSVTVWPALSRTL